MRKVIVNNIVSLDGYFADETGNPLALNMDAAFDRGNLESIESADLVLLGRNSFDGFSSYWPFVADAPGWTVAISIGAGFAVLGAAPILLVRADLQVDQAA